MKSTKTKLVSMLWVCCFGLLLPFGMRGQNTPELVKNIALPELGDLRADRHFETMGGITYFAGTDGPNGTELWRTDGTPNGTYLLKDIAEGTQSSNPRELAASGNTLFFVAYNEQSETSLWKTDGTEAGTQIVKDLPIDFSTAISLLTDVGNNTILFRLTTDDGLEPWISDGTEAGTFQLKDINPGQGSSFPNDFIRFNGAIYFAASNPNKGIEIWKSDGTTAGTQILKDIYPGSGGSGGSYNLTLFNGELYFFADDGVSGRELWKSDGTAAGTQLVKDINPGSGGSGYGTPVLFKNKLYFAANDVVNGIEIWASDGTSNGTQRISDINPGAEDGLRFNAYFMGNDDYLLFKGVSSTNDEELWRTDGTTAGTQLVKDIDPASSSRPELLFEINGKIIFQSSQSTPNFSSEYWLTNGTEAGTQFITKGFNNGVDFARNGGKVFFQIDDAGDAFIYETDGSLSGTQKLKYLPEDEFAGSYPSPLQPFNNDFLFFAKNSTSGYQLWKTDGNANTQLVKETNISPNNLTQYPNQTAIIGNKIYYVGEDHTGQSHIYASDGTEAGTEIISDNWFSEEYSFRTSMAQVNGTLYFDLNLAGISYLYKFTIGDSQPVFVKTYASYGIVGASDKVYALRGEPINPGSQSSGLGVSIYETDGTDFTVFASLGIAGRYNPIYGSIAVVNDKLYHTRTNVSSHTLFYDNEEIYNIITAFGPIPQTPISSNDRLFWASANNQTQPGLSEDLLKYENGTTSVVKSFADGVTPYNLTDVAGTIFFVAEEGNTGLELWKSDGTEAGTVLVRDLLPGSGSSHPQNLISHNGQLYFSANTGSGNEIWVSDGTLAGTKKVANFPNGNNANLQNFVARGNELFFSGDDGQLGQELWKVDLQLIQAAGPDVELSMSASELNPPVYTNTTITVNLSNTGDSPLTGLTIALPVPTGLAFVSQNIGKGTYSNWVGEWKVDQLAAGEMATMELTLFTLTDQQIDIFSEVAAQNESETDSSPGNGNAPNPSEDDEAVVNLNATGTPCSFGFIAVSVGACNDNGTSDPSDDYYTFGINPTGSNLAATYDLVGSRPIGPNFFINDLPYGQPYLSGNQLISDGDISLEIQDGNGVCVETLTITAPASCGPTSDPELSIGFSQSNTIATFPGDPIDFEVDTENNGTGGTAVFKTAYYLSSDFSLDNNDQLLLQTSDALAAGAAEVNMETITLDASTPPGAYYIIAKIDDEDVYAEADEANNIDRQRVNVWSTVQNDCEEFYQEADEVVCTILNGNGNYESILRKGDTYSRIEVDVDGNQLSTLTPVSVDDAVVNVVDQKIEKKNRNGGIIYSIDLPAAVINTYNSIVDADELIGSSTGYVLSAAIGNTPYAVFLDDNLNIISETALLENFSGPVVATVDGGAMIGTYRAPPTLPQGTTTYSHVHKVNPSNELEYDFPLTTFVQDAKRLPCSNRVSFSGVAYRAGGGSSSNRSHTFVIEDLGNSSYKLISYRDSGFVSNTPVSNTYTDLSVYQDDGTTLKFSYFNQPAVPNVSLPEVLYYRLQKLDINDNPLFTKELEKEDLQFASVQSIYDLGNEQLFVLGIKQNRYWYFQPECNDTPPAICVDNLLSNPGYESSTNFPSGWFSLGGTSITNEANTGDNALLISGNATGGILQNLPGVAGETYTLRAQVKRTSAANEGTGNYISLKFLSASWQPLETLVSIVPAGNDFEEYGRSFTAPAGTAYVEAKAYKDNGDFEMIVDDWCLTQAGGSPCDNDNVPPVFTSCPNDITVYTTGTSAIVNWTPATATDNCGIETITGLPYQPGDAFPVGNYSLGVTAIDLSGNSTSCTFLVSVIQQTSNQPDLTLSQLNAPATATTNSTLSFEVDLANIGNGDATGNFSIKSYLSTDQTLSTDDYQDGIIIPTGNLAANTSVPDVPGALAVPSNLAPGDYYLLLVVDADNQIGESNENNNLIVSSSTIAISGISNNGTDLNLSISSDITTIEAWQSFSVSLSLTNEGTSPASNVVVDFPQPAGAVFQGGNEYTASQGTYNSYDPQEWNVGSIPAGATATITFNLFSIQGSNPLLAYSQVLSMDQNDADSSPGNGTCCTANEDDEAALTIPTGTTTAQNKQATKDKTPQLELAKLYPNPAIDQIQMVVQAPLAKSTIVQVYNSIGQLVIADNISLSKGVNQLILDISLLDSGMYFIYLPEGHAKKNQLRFVKERN